MPSLRRSLPILGAGAEDESPLWRSLAEKDRGVDRAAAASEFAPGASAGLEAPFAEGDGTSRRGFLQLLGGSLALAGVSGCIRRPREQALPYTRQPEGVVPGKPLHYATSTQLGGTATGLLVTAYEGRPTKIEGNPEHPDSRGASGLLEQASLLSLYDPQRASVVKLRGSPRSFRAFLAAQSERATALKAKDQGSSIRFLAEPSSSPLLAHLRERVRRLLPGARFQAFSQLTRDAQMEGARIAFGDAMETRVDLAKARIIVSLDSDLLSSFPGNLASMRGFAAGRDLANGELNRLYVVETALTVTGASADHRLPIRPSRVSAIAAALLARMGALRRGELARYRGLAGPQLPAEEARFVAAMAKDLAAHAGDCVVVAGAAQPAAVHAIVHALNAGLGNAGKTVAYAKPSLLDEQSGTAALSRLVDEIRAGKVDTLVITARNPVYGAPADLEMAKALALVPNSIYLAPYEDETAAQAAWFLPQAHELEAWGDGRGSDGTVTFQQPLVSPLFNGLTEADVLAAFLGEGERGPYAQLRQMWQERVGSGFEEQWSRFVSEGMMRGSATEAKAAPARWDAIAAAVRESIAQPAEGEALEVRFVPDYKLYDGRFASNAWLQEMPDPITRLSWDNAALFAPATAQRLGLSTGEVVELSLRGKSVRAPVLVQPGQAKDAVTLPLGYGRAADGEALAQGVGFNANAIRTTAGYFFDRGLEVKKVAAPPVRLVQTQEHHAMEGRSIAFSLPLEHYEKEGKEELSEVRGAQPSLQPEHAYDGFKWAMAIDLGRCTGCNACVIACQSENNVPVVGRENVAKSREMHWLRVDRYFKGDEDNPEVVPHPMLCQHCEAAPCEYVCPVNATVHDEEGLNVMVYNRCVGTRYCSNNCPYKVRRFNFFNYTAQYSSVERMAQNPDVTVRARGVMEKCTYCVQRIERARIDSRVAGKAIKDGDVVSACAQACPAQAIVFGSLHDPGSRVAKLHRDPRRFDTLHELGTRPRTAYLARVKNPNPELA